MSELTLTVFTHPACSGCPEAVREAWELAEERPELELRTVTLAEADGLAEARRQRVTVIPAFVLARGDLEIGRWQGLAGVAELEIALADVGSAWPTGVTENAAT